MVKIISVDKDSIAADLGIKEEDILLSVNGKTVSDRLDYRFYSAEENIELHIRRNEEEIIFDIEKDIDEDIGIHLQDMKLKACGNNCVFCFVYQNPKGMRKPLYFKDEDFRFSFLYGHYVTLTTLKQEDLERIVEQRLSPLYISVHSTELKTRQLLLGIKRDDHLLQKIEYLSANGIELHAQIVLCPEINDGRIFDKTINDLKSFHPAVRSVAVVPLGLTKHRRGLMKLRNHNIRELNEMIDYTNKLREELKNELGDPFVYISDEFFIKAKRPLPDASYYGEFYQIENGVGEFRDMIDRYSEEQALLPDALADETRITWVTGALAGEPLEKYIINPLRKIKNLYIDLVAVENNFYGSLITVSGLLTGEDIFNQLKEKESGDVILLPPRVLNNDGLFLDDWTVQKLENELKVPCHVFTEPISALPDIINRLR